MEERFSLKDHLFNKEKIHYLGGLIECAYPEFKRKAFERKVLERFPELELKERITWISRMLKEFLPQDYHRAVSVLLRSLPEELDPNKQDDDFGDFIFSPYAEFVAHNGCAKKDLQFSLGSLEEMTKRFSAEDAMRYFLNAYPQETLQKIEGWAQDANYHVRRLASEGTRPSLPWSQKVSLDHKRVVGVLDGLFCDPTRYVVRSVANHMNDMSKVDSILVVKTLKRWERSGKQNKDEMEYLKKHALRTLIKKGDIRALKFLGYSQDPDILVKKFVVKDTKLLIGESLEFCFDIIARADERLMVDYVIYFPDISGLLRPKVFKIKKLSIKKDERKVFVKKHPLRQMTTKKLYKGEYMVQLQINGKRGVKQGFHLDI